MVIQLLLDGYFELLSFSASWYILLIEGYENWNHDLRLPPPLAGQAAQGKIWDWRCLTYYFPFSIFHF
jgi:hypothetical protein